MGWVFAVWYPEGRRAGTSTWPSVMLFSGMLLNLVLHVPAGCRSYPTDAEQSLLHAAGVSVIVADEEESLATTCLPIIHPVRLEGGASTLHVDGTSRIWLRGDRATLFDRAETLPAKAYIASLPAGGAASEPALRRSCMLAWQLTRLGCAALVLPWTELEAAVASDGWSRVTSQLTRMRQPEWTMIHGG